MSYYNFAEISERIKFKELFDKLGIVYVEDGGELKGEFEDNCVFIVNKAKNLFFCPKDRECKGSVINFTAYHCNCSVTEAAKMITEKLFKESKLPEREIPDLKLHYSPAIERLGISIETCRALDVGLVKERSVMAGKIAFTIKDNEGNKVGYVGWSQSQGWYFPKGHKNIYLYNVNNCKKSEVKLVTDTFDVVRLYQQGIDAISLMSSNMTDEQEAIIKAKFSTVIVALKNPANIVMRLANSCFVKIE